MPAIADMTRIQAGQSIAQIEGSIAAVADWNLAAGDGLLLPAPHAAVAGTVGDS